MSLKVPTMSCHNEESTFIIVKSQKEPTLILMLFPVQATVQKLLTEGAQLNCPVVPPMVGYEHVSQEDPHWAVYR